MTELALPSEILDGDLVVGREQLAGDVARLASGLADRGVGAGAAVVVSIPTSYEFVVLDRALDQLGAVMVNLPAGSRREVGQVARMVDSTLIVVGEVDDPHLFGDLDRWVSVRAASDLAAISGTGVSSAAAPVSEDEVTWLACGNGSTGTPRAAVHTRRSLASALRVLQEIYQVGSDDTVLVAADVGTEIGFRDGVRLACRSGARLVLQRVFDPGVAADLIERHRCTIAAVPTAYLYDMVAAGRKVRGLRQLLCEGRLLGEELTNGADDIFGSGVATPYFAPLECGPCLGCPPGASADQRAHSHGVAMPGYSLEIVDADEQPLPPAALEGELVVRAPGVALRYLMRNDTEQQFHSDGRFMTRERVRRLPDGSLAVSGMRDKNLIVRDGYAVAPRELEDALSVHPKVGRAVVSGRADRRSGEAVVAVLTAPEGQPERGEIERWLAECGISRLKWPDRLLFVEQLPVGEDGKIDRAAVSELAGQDASG